MKYNHLAVNIIKKGLSNVDFSKLDSTSKKEMLTKVSDLLLKEGKVKEAVEALILCNNQEKLTEVGDYFLRQNKFDNAALFLIPTKEHGRLTYLGFICIREGMYKIALEIYRALGDKTMAEFIEKNFI